MTLIFVNNKVHKVSRHTLEPHEIVTLAMGHNTFDLMEVQREIGGRMVPITEETPIREGMFFKVSPVL